jgi:hypothetical protein
MKHSKKRMARRAWSARALPRRPRCPGRWGRRYLWSDWVALDEFCNDDDYSRENDLEAGI